MAGYVQKVQPNPFRLRIGRALGRKGRLKLPLAFVLEIAETLDRDPLEIIVSLAYPKARERDKAGLKDVYFRVALRGITNEMAANSRAYGWRPGRGWKR